MERYLNLGEANDYEAIIDILLIIHLSIRSSPPQPNTHMILTKFVRICIFLLNPFINTKPPLLEILGFI
jgi:hypothetical protein